MSVTKRSRKTSKGSTATAILLGLLTLFGLLLRSLRLNWQPLWWDEGYSVYFATEPLQQMFGLTALDIHPPLYYASLYGWIELWGSPNPIVVRSFSVAAGVLAIPLFGWMASQLFWAAPIHATQERPPKQPSDNQTIAKHAIVKRLHRWPSTSPISIGVLLFAVNPLHIYYSQEVRMYGMALVFTLWSTGSFWRLLNQPLDGNQDGQKAKANATAKSWLKTSGPYIVATTLALYTLYYSALIPIAHLAYTLWQVLVRRVRPIGAATRLAVTQLVAAQLVVALLYLPWVLYAAPQLLAYISDKIGADNDTPLMLPAYLGRHLLAFLFGHLPLPIAELESASVAAGWALLIVSIIGLCWWRLSPKSQSIAQRETISTAPPANESATQVSPTQALWAFVIVPTAIAFVLNLRLPFFPEGGERLLLLVLPYFLLLMATGLAALKIPWLRYGTIILFLAISSAAILLFYTTPRHQERDYRSLVQHVMQNGRPEDRVLAIFPWQVGYWRAYTAYPPEFAAFADVAESGQSGMAALGPIPTLLGSDTLEWGDAIRQQLDAELQPPGTLWFPAPRGLGSDLPKKIESYLRDYEPAQVAADGQSASTTLLNIDARWANPTTFLTAWSQAAWSQAAWSQADLPEAAPVSIQFGSVALAAAGIGTATVQSANQVLPIDLTWLGNSSLSGSEAENYIVTLVLEDDSGRSWAKRNYSWAPEVISAASEGSFTVIDQSGLLVPVGLPPGAYAIKVGLSLANAAASAEASAASQKDTRTVGREDTSPAKFQPALQPIPPVLADENRTLAENFVSIGSISVTAPRESLSTVRLPTEQHLANRPTIDGITFVGSSGAVARGPFLAGTEIPLRLQLQNNAVQVNERHFYVSMLDTNGAGVAGWAAWPLPNYPITEWAAGALVQLPADVQVPAMVASGEYRLIAGLLNPDGGEKSEPVEIGVVEIVQRKANFEQPADLKPLTVGPARFGSHVDLLDYSVGLDAGVPPSVSIQLEWHVQQSLLPSHHIFIHLVDEHSHEGPENNTPLAQHDDIPSALLHVEGNEAAVVVAPSGSWQPGEYLTTQHTLILPEGVDFIPEQNTFAKDGSVLQLSVGLYVPQSGVRLPVSIGDQPSGDSVELE